MSKGIDYSKWDNFVDEEDDDKNRNNSQQRRQQQQRSFGDSKTTKLPKKEEQSGIRAITMFEESVGDIDDMIGAKAAKQKDSDVGLHVRNGGKNPIAAAEANSLLLDFLGKGGKVNQRTISDYYTAAQLLDLVTPDGVEKRKMAQAKKGDCYLYKDPVVIHLSSLVFKLREGPQHCEEILQQDVLNRILSVMKDSRPQKYQGMGPGYSNNFQNPNRRPATREEQLVAKELCCDQYDLILCAAVLHEICRYRSGCVSLAEDQKCLDFLVHEIPTQDTFGVSVGLTSLDFGEPKPEDSNAKWDSLLPYSPGMIEQGIIDTFGRLLNGLDQHPALRKKVAKKVKQKLPLLDLKVSMLETLAPKIENHPMLFSCIDLNGSMKKLKTMVSSILGRKPVKAWKSTFLFDRKYIDDPKKIGEEDAKISNQRECQFCQKKPEGKLHQVCSKCKTVFYCSRECQVKDWKNHKKNCIKHKGTPPSARSCHTGLLKDTMAQLQSVGIGGSASSISSGRK